MATDMSIYTTAGDPPLSNNFAVQIDAISQVQIWMKVEGLSVDIKLTPTTLGASSNPTPQGVSRSQKTPGKLTLTRPLGPSSADIYKWCNNVNNTGNKLKPTNGIVILVDPGSKMLYEWTITGIMPTNWKISTFDVSVAPTPVIETLTLSYADFDFKISSLS